MEVVNEMSLCSYLQSKSLDGYQLIGSFPSPFLCHPVDAYHHLEICPADIEACLLNHELIRVLICCSNDPMHALTRHSLNAIRPGADIRERLSSRVRLPSEERACPRAGARGHSGRCSRDAGFLRRDPAARRHPVPQCSRQRGHCHVRVYPAAAQPHHRRVINRDSASVMIKVD